MKTLQDRFIEALTKQGESEVKRTHKRIVYSRKSGGYYYIGNSGSLRVGATSVGSIPANSAFKVSLLKSLEAVDN